MKLQYFLRKIKEVKGRDLLSFFRLAAAGICRPFLRKEFAGEKFWVICEDGKEARDNGYWFFRYMCERHPEQKVYYAIDFHSPDYEKVKKLGPCVRYGSVRHWVLYLLAQYNISSQKGGKPDAAVCAFLELNNMINSRLVFLQHGVNINHPAWMQADVTQLDYLITSARPEYEDIVLNFGYPKDKILLTGMPRFDDLHDIRVKQNQILIVPTWRAWLTLHAEKASEQKFLSSEYMQKWIELLNSSEIDVLMKKYQLNVIFLMHRNMYPYVEDIRKRIHPGIRVPEWMGCDVHELMKQSQMMITDYSSVFFDMVYMKKPVVFYQFDHDRFVSDHYQAGWFDYRSNPFGRSFERYDDVLSETERIILRNYIPSEAYLRAHEECFPLYDMANSERIFQMISGVKEG